MRHDPFDHRIDDPKVGAQVQEILRRTNYDFNSKLRTSISPNVIKRGFRYNVIPGDALATLDVRALPDENMDAFVETLKKLIDDPAIEVTLSKTNTRPATPPSRFDTEMFLALARATAGFPGSVTIPEMGAVRLTRRNCAPRACRPMGSAPSRARPTAVLASTATMSVCRLRGSGRSSNWSIGRYWTWRRHVAAGAGGENLHMGGLFEVSRKLAAWTRQPDPLLVKKLQLTTNPKADPVRLTPRRTRPGRDS